MTTRQKEAIELIEHLPDEQIVLVIDMVRKFNRAERSAALAEKYGRAEPNVYLSDRLVGLVSADINEAEIKDERMKRQ